MKILLVHNKYKQPGGEDYVFNAEKELLIQYGHRVDCLIFDNSDIRTFLDKCLVGFNAIYNPESARILEDKILLFRPDVIHIHNLFPIASPSIILMAKKWSIPVIVTLHNYRLICPSAILFHRGQLYLKSVRANFPWRAIVKKVYRNSVFETAVSALMTGLHRFFGTWHQHVDLYICLTHFAKEIFARSSLSLPEHKIVVKPNFVADYGYENTSRNDYVLFVGRLSEEKGIKTLLQAAELYPFKLVIIGEGPLQELAMTFALKNSNIQYLGFQNKEVVILHMKMCRALIFPSLWYEGLPVTLLEAFSTGTVVVASNLGSMAEIIEDKVNGILFSAGDAKDLAGKIAAIYEHQFDTVWISTNARSTYVQHYTGSRNYASLVNIYNKAIRRKEQVKVALAGVSPIKHVL